MDIVYVKSNIIHVLVIMPLRGERAVLNNLKVKFRQLTIFR